MSQRPWDNTKHATQHLHHVVPAEERQGKGLRKYAEIIAKNVPKMGKRKQLKSRSAEFHTDKPKEEHAKTQISQ